ncbi:MAG: threonylcarbamoyl-AMP synthase [Bacteroidetes bacterium]|uniref:L-threonylcarbamoyladenylate synthase n=1 Tax=Candidatus Cryptobacteroides intestinigallinarum TaxID=2840767 RepID=A0A9D9HM16_9BACT|nr:threonylcarbamoyl-AMP synthase [Candidatus Cryptobacteroides intestinigallinarum]
MEFSKETLDETLSVLKKGGVILYPTDTVWGLGCDATDPEAVAKIYRIKNRSDSKSLVLLASDMDMIARFVREVPEMAVQLVEVNDRPMTIIYPGAMTAAAGEPADRHLLAHNVVAEDGSVGIRIPMMDFCVELVRRLGRPVVSTSANISGEPTPKNFSEVSDPIRKAVDYTVDPALESGATGQSSSIIKLGVDSTIQIIRK